MSALSLFDSMGACSACPLAASGNNHIGITGEGNPTAGLFIVGDRPSKDVDDREIPYPFSGMIGPLFKNLLGMSGIKYKDVWVTYAIKCCCRDFRNKELQKVSKATCPPIWLDKEIEEFRPKVVVVMGNEALEMVMGLKGIMKYRGALLKAQRGDHEFLVMPTLSPFALREKSELIPQVVSDFKRAAYAVANGAQSFTQETLKELDYKFVKTPEMLAEMLDEIRTRRIVAVDTETRGNNFVKPKITCPGFPLASIQFSTKAKTGWFVPIANESYISDKNPLGLKWGRKFPEVTAQIKAALEDPNVAVVGHNFKFDAKWLRRYMGITPNLRFDTMLVHGLFGETSNSLKKMAWEAIPEMGGYDDEQARYTESLPKDLRHDMFRYPLRMLFRYGCGDADVTYRVFEILRARLNEPDNAPFKLLSKILRDAHHIFSDLEFTGLQIDRPYLENLQQELLQETKQYYEEFRLAAASHIADIEKALVQKATGKSGRLLKGKRTTFNMNSADQVATLLYGQLDLPINPEYISWKTQKPSVGKAALVDLRGLHECIPILEKWRVAAKQKVGFADSYLKLLDEANRVHTDYSLVKHFSEDTGATSGAATGRLASKAPNVQQMPTRGEGKRVKRMAFPDWEEHCLVDIDYSQLEIRVAAMHCKDPEMVAMVNAEGSDYHAAVAAKVYGVALEDVTKEQRRNAKTINFAVLYGAGPHKVAFLTGMELPEAEKFIKDYFEVFPGLRKWIGQQHEFAKQNGYVQSMFGRRRILAEAASSDPKAREHALRLSVNSPVQGDASDLTLYGLTRIYKYLKTFKHTDPTKPTVIKASVHDSILFSAHLEDFYDIAENVKRILESPDLPFISRTGVRLRADVSVGPNWGDQEDLTFDV